MSVWIAANLIKGFRTEEPGAPGGNPSSLPPPTWFDDALVKLFS
jgi:hypothetical protein